MHLDSQQHRSSARYLFRICCMLVLLMSCVHQRRDPAQLPKGFDGHLWGELIEDFSGIEKMEYAGATVIEDASCGLWQPIQLVGYFKPEEPFSFPEVTVSSVLYLFCYNGIASTFCGTNVNFDSEEFELAGQYLDDKSTYDRIYHELVRRHGRPYRSNRRSALITVYNENGKPLPHEVRFERSSWCAVDDPGESKTGCPSSVVLSFDPLLGRGSVLYSTPPMANIVEDFQRYYPYPSGFYEKLFANAKPKSMPIPAGCGSPTEKHDKDPFARLGPLDKDLLFSEKALDIAAYRKGTVREISVRRLSAVDFYVRMRAAQDIVFNKQTHGLEQAYWLGYIWGMSWTYYGGRFGNKETHEKWLKAINASDDYVKEVGRGYQDGVTLTPNPNKR